MSVVTKRQIISALKTINDPELGVDLVSLGLIYETRISGSEVFLRLTLTTPGCPLIDKIISDVRAVVAGIAGVESVKVELTFDPPWSPDRMTVEAKELLGLVRKDDRRSNA